MARSSRLVGSLSLFLLLPAALPAQAPEALSVAEVTEDRNRDFVPDRLGDTVVTRGVVTSEPHRIGAQAWIMNLEDATGGLTVFTRDSTILTGGLQRGDTLRVRGIVGQYRGIEQLRPLEVRRRGSGPAPQPREVLAADLQGEAHSSRLVRVTGELRVTPTPAGAPEVWLRDRSGEIRVYVRTAYLGDPDFTARLLREGGAEIVGIASQSDQEPPFDSGYEIVPRDLDDFHLAPVPPYRLLAVLAAISALAVLAAFLAVRRRTAERRAGEMAALADDLRRSEEALRASEERLRLLLSQTPAILWSVDRDLRFTFGRGGGLRTMGLDDNALLEMSIMDYFGTQDPEFPPVAAHHRAIAGEASHYETEWMGRIFETRIEPLHGPDGSIIGAVAVSMDLTERKEAETALRKREHHFRALIENARDIITILEADGSIRYESPAVREVLGYEPEELVGWNAFELVHPDDYAPVREVFETALREPGAVHSVEFRYRHRDGTWRRLEGRGTNLLHDPAIGGIVVNSRDVTEERHAERELRIRTAYLEQLFRSAPEGIAILDADDRVIRANEEFLRIFGYREEEVVERTINSLIVPDDRHEEALDLTRKTTSGQRIAVETVRRHKDGRAIPVSILATPIELEGRPVAVYGIYRDITEQKEAKEALRASEEQLRQAQKMEAVGRLAGGIAHDFNNLLTIMRGSADLLLMDLPGDSPFRDDVEEIRRASDRAAGLTRQLLAFGRKQVLQAKVLDLNRVVEEAGAMLRRLIGADIEFRTILDPALGCVKADPGQIEQVLVNLVVNARDAMPSGGTLTLTTRNVSLDGEYGRTHPEVAPGRYAMLSVSDTGTGMDAATRERIWEPFFTTKEQGKGTGLGLSTVYGIVKQSGGHVAVYSEPGHGSVFRIYLPRVDEGTSPDSASAPASLPEPARGSETVLLVEDEAPVRELASRVLARHGYMVLEAQDGEEALRLYEAHDGSIHLLLTDVVMPRMGGPALTAHLSPRHPGLRVLYVSGYAGDTVLLGGAGEPEIGFLQKPFAPGELIRKVREVMDHPPPGGVPAR